MLFSSDIMNQTLSTLNELAATHSSGPVNLFNVNTGIEMISGTVDLVGGEISQSKHIPSLKLCLVSFLLLIFVAFFQKAFHLLLARPTIPDNAPKHWLRYDWPIVGSAPRFYSRRKDMQVDGTREVLKMHPERSGSFSFFVGKKHVVAVAPGEEARRAVYENRGFNFAQGFVELMAGLPSGSESDGKELADWSRYFNKTLTSLMRSETVAKHLPSLKRDTRDLCEELAAKELAHKSGGLWRVTDPFESVYSATFRLTIRILGATELAENRILSKMVQVAFDQFEKNSSTARIIFPWLLTPAHAMRMAWGFVVSIILVYVIRSRKRGEQKSQQCKGEQRGEVLQHDDALQYLMDQGADTKLTIKFELNALWAGILNTGLNASWLITYLAVHPQWQARCRAEVDRVISCHRLPSHKTAADTMDSLPLQEWESGFPVLQACLRECIRLAAAGTVFRKNTSGHDIVLDSRSGEVVPHGSFAAFVVDHMHMDPELFPNPMQFNPGRYLPDHVWDDNWEKDANTKAIKDASHRLKEAHTYLGWGSGLHPCIGARLAKTEIALITAHLLSSFEFELSDKYGRANLKPLRQADRNGITIQKPSVPVYLRYKTRVAAENH